METEFAVPEKLDGERLDKVLTELAPGFSRRKIRAAIGKGSVYLNDRRCLKVSRTVRTGDRIRIAEEADTERVVQEESVIEVIYDADGLVAVNKPPLCPSTPTRESLRSAQQFVAGLKKERMADVHPVNRLDLPVSGVLIFACGRETAAEMERLKAGSMIEKTYIAWVKGTPGENSGKIDVPISSERGRAFADPCGKPSITFFKVLRVAGEFSLLEVNPVTGRFHQIRAHLKIAGFPIVGDRKYGEAPYPAKRPLLHCLRISFPLPQGSKVLSLEAPPPLDFEEFRRPLAGSRT